MWMKLLRNTEWKQLSAFVTPAFLEVVSVRELLARARSIKTSREASDYRDALGQRGRQLSQLPLAVEPRPRHGLTSDALGRDAAGDAARVVTLYFHQIFSPGSVLLDLRGEAFSSASETDGAYGLRWRPAPWVCRFDPAFRAALRDVYVGFYQDDDPRFMGGLDRLGIRVAAPMFREHFGDNPSAQVFQMSHFIDTFHRVFVRCRDSGVKLHADFLPLGIYLAGLYDYLDATGLAVDVRACFERATGASNPVVEEMRSHG